MALKADSCDTSCDVEPLWGAIKAFRAEHGDVDEDAESYEAAFHADERRLGILSATHFPRATDHVPEMIAIIERTVP